MNTLLEQAERLGLQGQEALRFLREQQELQRIERVEAREEAERQREEAERQRQHELAMAERRQNNQDIQLNGRNQISKSPKLPVFNDGKDDIHSYLQRFERFARANNWTEQEWAVSLSALLTGKALEVYSRMSEENSSNYEILKAALLKRYDFTEEGYHKKFRTAKPEQGESPDQFIFRLRTYLDKWIELSRCDKSYEGVCNTIIKEQFVNSCPKELSVFLKERATKDLHEIALAAEQYLSAHQCQLATTNINRPLKTEEKTSSSDTKDMRCYNCNGKFHKASDCWKNKINNNQNQFGSNKKTCTYCKKDGHDFKECRRRTKVAVSLSTEQEIKDDNYDVKEASSGLLIQEADKRDRIFKNIKNDALELANGDSVSIITNVCSTIQKKGEMPVVDGFVNNQEAKCLRDTGCNGIVVKQKFVSEEQYTGNVGYMLLVDNTVRKARKAVITIDTPYLQGDFEALCLPDVIYDLIIGNVPQALPPDQPRNDWKRSEEEEITEIRSTCEENNNDITATTKVTENNSDIDNIFNINTEQLQKLQEDDVNVQKCLQRKSTNKRKYASNKGIIYEITIEEGKETEHKIVLPTKLHEKIMNLGHDIPMAGHLGYKKTLSRIKQHFVWPGMTKDVREYCSTCDICQKTSPKGKEAPVPLGKIPLVDTLFQRIAFDIIGPLPKTNENHRYVLTLVDYATRYPEAVALKDITAETVANAMVSIYSRMGLPEEILTDQGTQFTAEYMSEINKLLKIKHLTTTPYHPQCNGLVESFNKTLKSMIKRMSNEQPRRWHEFLDPLLFAYREVPQATTGFSPFELLYGRSVRGPLSIVKSMWSEGDKNEEKTYYQYFIELREHIQETLKIAKEEIDKAHHSQKSYYDRKTKEKNIKIGDEVLILLPTDTNKMKMKWKGPHKVIAEPHNNDFKIKMRGKIKTFHANMLKKYNRRKSITEDTTTSCNVVIIDEHEKIDEEENKDLFLIELESNETYEDIIINDDIDATDKEEIQTLIKNYESIFTTLPGTTNLIEHQINLTTDEPIVCKPYSVTFNSRNRLKGNIKDMIEMRVIRKSNSEYASPAVTVSKKDGSDRVCIDFRKLNKITLPDPEPMTQAEDLFQKMTTAKYFSILDLSKGFWQVPMNENDIKKTAFVTPDGHYEFLKMPFGLKNSSATLIKGLRKLFDGMEHVAFYVDDIIVYTETIDEHLKVLNQVFNKLKNANITLRPSKCHIAKNEVDYIGHTLKNGTISPNNDKDDKIRNAPIPTTKKSVQAFLGLTGYYRKYVPNYASIAAPLHDLTKKGKPNKVKWTSVENSAFNTLKECLINKPVLMLPDFTTEFILRTDASNVGLGAVLFQEHDGTLLPVSYASRKLLEREEKYAITEKECLAIVWSVKKFAPYLYGNQFTLQTDHHSLKYLETSKFTNARLMRWALTLQPYRINVEYIKGKDNIGADYLSRQ